MSSKKVTLKSSDGVPFEVDVIVALESQKIKCMIEDDCADGGIPLPNVMSKILAKVIEYCKKHVEAPPKTDDRSADEDLKAWDAEFVKVDQATLYALILRVADMIKGKTPVKISKTSNLKNDSNTLQEEEEIRRENQWAFE